MRGLLIPALLLLLRSVLLCAGAPAPLPSVISRRSETLVGRAQGDLNAPVTVQVSNSTDTPQGVMTETCFVTLSPTKRSNGADVVEVVRRCEVSLVKRDPAAQSSSQTHTPTNIPTSPPSPPSPTPTLSPSPQASNGTSPVGAAAAQESPPYTVQGKKLSVLPIGLGVLAGVSVIGIIVVGYVTYERTRYRKAFRERKLAEAGFQGL